MRKTGRFVLLLVPLLWTSLAFADVSLTFSDGSFVRTNDRYMVAGDKEGFIIIETGKSGLIIVDHKERTYMEVSETFVEDTHAMMAAKMEQMLAAIPPEQRAMFEQSMADMMAGGGAKQELPKMNVRKTGKQDTFAGHTCSEVEISYGDGEVEEIACVATVDELGISERDYASLVAGTLSLSRMSSMNGDDKTIMDFDAMGGIPIRIRDLKDGDEDALVSLSHEKLADDMFAIPPGYRKVSMEDMIK